ncbi:MAG: ferrous iron transport protein A [Phycisphaerales bacterium]|nr:ferrous iron transport protein A [Phycisphaerales bacterium]
MIQQHVNADRTASIEPKPASIPLTQLARGQRATVNAANLDEQDSRMIRAMGLRPDASVQMCRLGEPCIVSLSGACGGGCRIGLAKDIASRVLVTPHS